MQNTQKLYNKLPLLLEDLDILILKPATHSSEQDQLVNKQFERSFQVRQEAVKAWLVFLKINHSDYRSIEINLSALRKLPENTSVQNVIHSQSDKELNITSVEETEQPQAEREKVDFKQVQNHSSFISNLHFAQSQIDMLKADLTVANHLSMPSFQQTPLSEWNSDNYILRMIFPTLYPYKTGDFQQARQRTVKMSDYFQHFMKYKDYRFAQHSRFRYVAFNILMRSRVKT